MHMTGARVLTGHSTDLDTDRQVLGTEQMPARFSVSDDDLDTDKQTDRC